MRKVLAGLPIVFFLGCASDRAPIGGSCETNGGCERDLLCDTTIPGGYCTKACATPGQASECPEGAVCDAVAGKGVQCVQICQRHEDCRSSLDCNGVSGTNIKACKPKAPTADAGTTDAKKP